MKRRGGFTIIELMVVMSIIAVLTVLSVGFLKDLYDTYKVTQASEEILGLIREAQSKARGVEGGPAFGVEVAAKRASDSTTVNTISYVQSGNSLVATPKSVDIDVTTIELDRYDIQDCYTVPNSWNNAKCGTSVPTNFTNPNRSFVINFSSPFGMPEYFLRDTVGGSDGSNGYCSSLLPISDVVPNSATTACAWKKNTNYLDSYSVFHLGPTPTDTAIAGTMRSDGVYNQNGGHLEIRLAYNGAKRTVVVEGSGETYIQ